jgi:5-methylthioadenosine/S-adenosylhomocysteine deaminase
MVPHPATLLVFGDWLAASAGQILPGGGAVVDGDTIVEIGPAGTLLEKYPAARRYGGPGRLVLPGLINSHLHLFQTFLKGLGQGLPLRSWIQRITTPAALAMDERDVYLSAMLGLMESVHSGVTSLFEYSYAFPGLNRHEAILQAFVDVGLRGWLGLGLNDAGQEFGVHPALIQPLDVCLARADTLAGRIERVGQGRLALALTPSSLRGLSVEGLLALADYARRHELILSLHLNETNFDNEASLARAGRRAVPWLADLGVLGPEFLAAHCVQLLPEEINLLAQAGAAVVHNPVSNMYLGAGLAPVAAMRQAGLAVGLGTDGAASNNSQDMIETMKLAVLGQRLAQGHPAAFSAAEAFAMATADGSRALRREERLGRLAPGCLADLAVVRLDTSKSTPVHDPLASLVFSAGEENVETVIVGGRVILDEGRLVTVDESALLAEAQARARSLVERAGIG